MSYPKPYILVDKEVVEPDTPTQYWDFITSRDRVLRQDRIRDSWVSTIFLGIDMRLEPEDDSDPRPLVFETRIMGGPNDGFANLSRSYDDALETHHKICKMVVNDN